MTLVDASFGAMAISFGLLFPVTFHFQFKEQAIKEQLSATDDGAIQRVHSKAKTARTLREE